MKKTSIFDFGDIIPSHSYRVINEHLVVANARVMFIFGLTAFINGFFLKNFEVIPFISGFLVLNFLIGIFINRLMPTANFASLFIKNKKVKYIGAIQKKFAFILGAILTGIVFIMSNIFLITGKGFGIVCILCIICVILIGMEAFFNTCIGCKIYGLFLDKGWIKHPKEIPKCMGDHCDLK